jgi:hypothetical protein
VTVVIRGEEVGVTVWRTAAVVMTLTAFVSGSAAAQSGAPRAADATPFIGTWVFTMTAPDVFKGTQQTVRISEKAGVLAASFQVERFPPTQVTGIFKDGDMLLLTIAHSARPPLTENGGPIWAVISLTLDGDTMNMAQMLERSQTIKRGSAKKLAN